MEINLQNRNFWKYYDTYIPIEILNVPSFDKVNITALIGFTTDNKPIIVETQIYTSLKPYTVDEYHQKICKFNSEINGFI